MFGRTPQIARSATRTIGKSPGSLQRLSKAPKKLANAFVKPRGDVASNPINSGIPGVGSLRDGHLMTTEANEQSKIITTRRTTENPAQNAQQQQEYAKHQRSEIEMMLHTEGDENLGSMEDGRKSKVEFQKLQIIDISTGLAAGIGAYITIIAYDLEFNQKDNDLLKSLLWIVFGTTKVAILLNILRYMQKLKYQKSQNLISHKDDLFSSGEIWQLSTEIILLLLQPYPFLAGYKIHAYNTYEGIQYYYYVNDIFSILLCVRLYILLRILLNNTKYLSPSAKRLSSMYGADNDYLYACKCLMRNAPLITVLILFLGSIFVFGYMLRICERPLNRDPTVKINFSLYWDAMWCVILTMTTVGYGDFFARTHFGRLVSFFCCLWGVFVISLMVLTLGNVLSMTAPEERALTVLERLELRKNMKSEAAHVLTGLARMSLNNKKAQTPATKSQTRKTVNKVKRHLAAFKTSSRRIKNMSDNSNFGEEMTRQFDKMRDEIREVRDQHDNLHDMISELTEMLQFKGKTTNSIKLPDESPAARDRSSPFPGYDYKDPVETE